MEKDKNTLDYQRTLFASERTLMAWVRTSLSLISIGFSIPHFFKILTAAHLVKIKGIWTPKALGILLICMGTFGVLGGLWQHVYFIKNYSNIHGLRHYLSPSVIMSLSIGLAGFITVFVIIF